MRELLAILPGLFIGGRKVAGSPALWGGSVVPLREGAEPVGGVCVLDGTKHGYPAGGCHVVPDICGGESRRQGLLPSRSVPTEDFPVWRPSLIMARRADTGCRRKKELIT